MIRAIVYKPDAAPALRDLVRFDHAVREIVGGYIDTVRLTREPGGAGIFLACHDEGRLVGLSPCLIVTGRHPSDCVLVGPVVAFRTDATGDEKSLTAKDISFLGSLVMPLFELLDGRVIDGNKWRAANPVPPAEIIFGAQAEAFLKRYL